MEVFMVKNDWATDDSSDSSIRLFQTYEKAKEYYNEIILEEKSEFWSQAFENGEVVDGYVLDEGEDYFEIFEVNGEDYLSNTSTFEGLSCIPFPSFNLGDTFEIKFKLFVTFKLAKSY